VIASAKTVLQRMESEIERERGDKESGEKKVVVKTEVREHPLIEELKTLNVEQISPIEALNLLYEMKKKL